MAKQKKSTNKSGRIESALPIEEFPLESFSGEKGKGEGEGGGGEPRCDPRLVVWNSLEGRPRSVNVERALKAEVRDAMWMLSRQWQWGEFDGEDGGSLIFSRVSMKKTHLNRYAQGQGDAYPYTGNMPLEAQVERESVPIDAGMQMEMGRHWLRLLNHFLVENGVSAGIYDLAYIDTYPLVTPPFPSGSGSVYLDSLVDYGQQSTSNAWAAQVANNRRVVDGWLMYQTVLAGDHLADGIVNTSLLAHNAALISAGNELKAWFNRNYCQPGSEGSAWSPEHLEYQFSCAAPKPEAPSDLDWLVADEYASGHLDWYAFDLAPAGYSPPADASGQSFTPNVSADVITAVPSRLTFPGMPNARWWEFEEGKVDWGGLNVATTDVAKLLIMDFMFNYANDWYIMPYRSEVGSLLTVEGIELQDVFGVRTLVRHANEGNPQSWNRWNMFTLSPRGDQTSSETRLFLAPAAMQVMESPKLETVSFLRDEMANMAWGVEKTIPDGFFGGRDGQEAGLELFNFLKANAPAYTPPTPQTNDAEIKYKLATRVPENWIPFLPNHISSANRAIRLQRSAMPRDIPGMSTPVVEPRTALIRTGLDENPTQRYYINEEEVTKAGTMVHRTWQRTRWHDGGLCVWIGRRKQTGLGGGYSGLNFDQILEKED